MTSKQIRFKRRKYEITQKDLAEKLKVTDKYISNIERGALVSEDKLQEIDAAIESLIKEKRAIPSEQL